MKNIELQKILKSFPKKAQVVSSDGTPVKIKFYQDENGKWFIEITSED